MSRHRNLRNQDYYDDDEYYDDDYDEEEYEEEDEEAAQYRYEKVQHSTKTQTSKLNQQPKAQVISQNGPINTGISNFGGPPPGFGSNGANSKNVGGAMSLPPGFHVKHTKPTAPPAIVMDFSAPSKQITPKKTPILANLPDKAVIASIGSGKATPKNTKMKATHSSQKIHSIKSPPAPSSRATSPTPPSGTASSSTVSSNIKAQVPAPLSKDLLEQLAKAKPRLSMVILGHVDAGKSTLMGQVLVQLSKINQRTVLKFQKQAAEIGKASFALAWIMDEDESERERGVTMDVATKTISTPKYDVTILDAPGHKDFVPEMICGAASADVGLLVVAATTGEFESGFDQRGQTREHILLSRGLGVSQLLVAVNKLDAAETPWDEHRFNHIKQTLEPFLVNCGYKAERIRFVPVSGLTGENVLYQKEAALRAWYNDINFIKGAPTLMEALDLFQSPKRSLDKPLRFIVSDVYPEGKGVTLRGRVVQGLVRVGDSVSVMPIGDVSYVNRIEHGDLLDSSNKNSSTFAQAGDSVELNITGVDIARTNRGCVLCHVVDRVPINKKFQAKLLVTDLIDVPIIRGAQVSFHMQSIDVPAVISKLIEVTRRGGLQDAAAKAFASTNSLIARSTKPRVVTGGSTAMVEITLKDPLCLEEFSSCRALGRFVLRRKGDTVAVGLIEELL